MFARADSAPTQAHTARGDGRPGERQPAEEEGRTVDALVEYWTRHFASANAGPSSRILADWQLTGPVIRTVLGRRGGVCEAMFHAVLERAPASVYAELDAQRIVLFEEAVNYLGCDLVGKMSTLLAAARGDDRAEAALGPLHENLVYFCIGLKSMGFSEKDLSAAVADVRSKGAEHLSRHDTVRAFLDSVAAQTFPNKWLKLQPTMQALGDHCAARLFACQFSPPKACTLWSMVLRRGVEQPSDRGVGSAPAHAGRAAKVRVSAAQAVLSMLRFFDSKNVDVFQRLTDGTTVLDLTQARARDDASFDIVLGWLQSARRGGVGHAIGAPAKARACDRVGGNTGYPFSLAPACTAQAASDGCHQRAAADRQTAADADIMAVCNACGRTAAEAHRPLMRCTRCRGAAYCTKECQVAGWVLGHSLTCRHLVS